MKRIKVNNNCVVEIADIGQGHGIRIGSMDENGTMYRMDFLSDGDIIAALNLLRYMQDNDLKSVYLPDTIGMEEYRIFQ